MKPQVDMWRPGYTKQNQSIQGRDLKRRFITLKRYKSCHLIVNK